MPCERSNGGEYTYFRCPRAVDGNCDNHRYVPEEWLREVVAGKLRQRLFFLQFHPFRHSLALYINLIQAAQRVHLRVPAEIYPLAVFTPMDIIG